ncbi:Gfo/Idh/MocA family protein [Rhizobium laguerreae]|uniref:Gfo/Idh/MocA family protein n=1 Tax=Rhizobium laguerreae TaxID=1076926 RepID=UPI001C914B55|nr:Gfo/Idh/MocA family oxidoreductase [Rhizobium laguerreae]MBY3381805.1 Gfo/Idh/MocA family oxidoreductase [Rhizobium laguerreae]
MTGRKRSVAIVGVGHGHSNLYIPALLASEGGQVVAVSEPDAEKRAFRAAQLSVTNAYEDYEEMFDQHPDLDLVYVLGQHRHMARAAIKTAVRGYPFVIEKPGGMTLAEVLEIRDAVKNSGVSVAVPFVQRQGPLKTLFEQAGPVQHVSLQFLAGLSCRYRNGADWLLEREKAGGGVMLNLGVHFIDAFLHFCGDGFPVSVRSASLKTLEPDLEVEDHFSAVLESETGVTGFIEASYTYPSMNSRYVTFAVRGSQAFAVMGADGSGHVRTVEGVRELALDPDSDRYYAPFVEAVYATLSTGFAGLPTLDDLVKVREITDYITSINNRENSSH